MRGTFSTGRPGSLARATIARLLLVATLVMTVAGVAIYVRVLEQRRQNVETGLGFYASSRARAQEELFDRIAELHGDATASFRARLNDGSDAAVERAFDRHFPLRPDGTRRSAAELYSGEGADPSARVQGIGAYIAGGKQLSKRDKRVLLAALGVIEDFGPGFRGIVPNLAFFDTRNHLVVYAPNRPDRLLNYRERLPADFSFRSHPLVQATLRINNPDRRIRCSSLAETVWDRSGQRWTVSCQTPLDVEGEHVGGWTNSLFVEEVVRRVAGIQAPGVKVMVASADGKLIAHSELTRRTSSRIKRYLDLSTAGERGLAEAWAAGRGKPAGTVAELPSGDLLFVERVRGPDWYLFVIYDGARLRQAAYSSVTLAVALGAVMLIVQGIGIYVILRRKVVRPIRRLTDSARNLGEFVRHHGGAPVTQALPLHRTDEIGEMARVFVAMAGQVTAEHALLETKVAERTAELHRLATTDGLTGLANRRSFVEALDAELARSDRSGAPVALALFDVDHFKKINDGYGHPGGDAVLRALGERWGLGAREADRFGRLGGEEFGALLLETAEGDALTAAERVRLLGQGAAVPFDGGAIRFTMSAGVTAIAPGDTAKSALARADRALYAAKAAGRDRTLKLAACAELVD